MSLMLGLGPLVFVLFFGAIAGADLYTWRELSTNGAVAPGRIVQYEPGKFGYMVVEFTTPAGRHIRAKATLDKWSKPQTAGAATRVRYLPGDPTGPVREDGNNGGLFIGLLWSIPFLVSVVVTVFAWARLGLFSFLGRRYVGRRRRSA
jgi:hypothetical protein